MLPAAPRCPTGNCSSFPGQGCNAAAAPNPGSTCLSTYKVHVPWESPTCASHARDPQPGNSVAALFLNKAFEPNPIGKGHLSHPLGQCLGTINHRYRAGLVSSGRAGRHTDSATGLGEGETDAREKGATCWYPARDLGTGTLAKATDSPGLTFALPPPGLGATPGLRAPAR